MIVSDFAAGQQLFLQFLILLTRGVGTHDNVCGFEDWFKSLLGRYP